VKIAMFSKNIDSLPIDDAARQMKEMGFDGVGLTVRRGSG
jgi:sugar phosphate isomerase/epimerase